MRSIKGLFFILFFPLMAFAIEREKNSFDHEVIQVKKTRDPLTFMVSGTFASISNPDGGSLSGPGFLVAANYHTNPKQAVGINAGVLMGSIGASAATILSATYTYALTGNMLSTTYDYQLGDHNMASFSDVKREGFRVQGLLTQYYFNGSQNTLPFGGMGFGAYYEKYLSFIGSTAVAGFRYEMLFNNQDSLTPMTLFFGISF